MSEACRNLAELIVRVGARLSPSHRAEWARAMAAELDSLPDPNKALVFALGCLWSSCKERILFTATNPWRVARWSLAAVLLITPALAMQFTDEVNWSAGDFLTMGAMLLGAGVGYEFLTSRASGNLAYRIGAALAVGAAFLLVWVNLAVGIIGTEKNPANLMFAGVLAVGVGSALAARFEGGGMSRGMLATAVAQAVVGLIGVGAGLGRDEANWPCDIIGVTAIFCILWLIAGWLFARAARQGLSVFA